MKEKAEDGKLELTQGVFSWRAVVMVELEMMEAQTEVVAGEKKRCSHIRNIYFGGRINRVE